MWGQTKNSVALVEEIVALTQDRNLSKEDVATLINTLSLRRSFMRVVLQSALLAFVRTSTKHSMYHKSQQPYDGRVRLASELCGWNVFRSWWCSVM